MVLSHDHMTVGKLRVFMFPLYSPSVLRADQ